MHHIPSKTKRYKYIYIYIYIYSWLTVVEEDPKTLLFAFTFLIW